MTTHILGFTYKPKIVGVRDGYIRQTIRTSNSKRPKKVGDDLLLHDWKDRPYFSDWSWRRREVITELIPIRISIRGFHYLSFADIPLPDYVWENVGFSLWDCPNADRVAARDGIVPPTGLELKKVLLHYAGKKTPIRMDIIRW